MIVQGQELQHAWLSLSCQAALVMALRALHCLMLSASSPDGSNKTMDMYASIGKQALKNAAGTLALQAAALFTVCAVLHFI